MSGTPPPGAGTPPERAASAERAAAERAAFPERAATEDRPRADYGSGREALIPAVVEVVARRGLRGATYRSVAEAAGVAHGLVAHHYGSMSALIRAALREAVGSSLRATSFDPPVARIEDFAAGLPEHVERDRTMHAFQYELLLESRRDPSLAELLTEYDEAYRAAIGAQLRLLGLPDPALADVTWAALDGLVFQQVVHGRVEVTERALERIRADLRAARERD